MQVRSEGSCINLLLLATCYRELEILVIVKGIN